MSSHNETEAFDDSEEPKDPQLTELVAYLDGELDDAQSHRVERQLAIDAPLRIYAESLDRTWQLLDSLEDAAASGEFTQKTLASLQAQPVKDDEQRVAQKSLAGRIRSVAAQSLLRMVLWTAAGFLGCSLGLLFSRIQNSPQTDSADVQILQQLDLLRDYRKIRPVPSAEFLSQISALEEPSAEGEKAQ